MKLTQRSLTEITNILSESLKISRYCSRKRMNLKNTFKSTNCRVNWSNWKIINQLKTETEIKIIENKSIYLLNGIVSTFGRNIKKTGQPPTTSKNRFRRIFSKPNENWEISKKNYWKIRKIQIDPEEYVGSLGEKGQLHRKTNLIIQNGTHRRWLFSSKKCK
jgi:hypothetical protein